MKKRIFVCSLILAGIIGMAYGQERAVSSEHTEEAIPTQKVLRQTPQTPPNNETPIPASGSTDNLEGAFNLPSAKETALFDDDACRPEKIETQPCH